MTESREERTARREMSRKVVLHRLPLSQDGTRQAEFLLPPDMTSAEADRFAAFVAAIALPEPTD